MTYRLTCVLAVSASMVLCGCGEKDAATNPASESSATDDAAHAHGETGPHEGHLIELGDAFHAEIVADDDSQTVTVYLLDGQVRALEANEATAVTLSVFKDGDFVDYTLQASGPSGVFAVVDEDLCQMFDHDQDVKSRVKATIAGEEITGKYEHEAHDH